MSTFEDTPDKPGSKDDLVRLRRIERAATQLFVAVWRGMIQGWVPERGPVPDAALELRDTLNPRWPSDSDWLPEPLASERKANYPDIVEGEYPDVH
jgi:hypothetical protein